MRTGIIIALAVALLAGCAGSGAKDSGPITLYADDSGRTVRVAPGAMIYVTLDGNPTTGFTWEIQSADPQVLLRRDSEFHPSSDMPGAGGVWVFPFETGASGSSEIRMVYRRPWETVEPLRTFSVKIEVR